MRIHRHSAREGTRGIRAFAYVYSDDEKAQVLDARFEGYVASGAQHTGIGLSTDDDSNGLQLFAGLSRVACGWLSIGSPAMSSRLYRRFGRSLHDLNIADLRFHGRAVWWEIWHDKWSHSSKDPKWRSGNFHWWDWLTGKPVHSVEVLERNVPCVVPMPEGVYQARCTLERCTWKRPRWPYPKVTYGYDIDILSRPGPDGPFVPEGVSIDDEHVNGYVPVPGKGENSWDCGGDGTFSQSGPGRTVEAAVAGVVQGTLRDRRRRGAPADYAEPIT